MLNFVFLAAGLALYKMLNKLPFKYSKMYKLLILFVILSPTAILASENKEEDDKAVITSTLKMMPLQGKIAIIQMALGSLMLQKIRRLLSG